MKKMQTFEAFLLESEKSEKKKKCTDCGKGKKCKCITEKEDKK